MPGARPTRQSIFNAPDATVITKLAHHEAQLDSLAVRMGGVETSIATISGKLDQVISGFGKIEAKPVWDFNQVLQNIYYGAVLIGAAVAAIVYVSSNQSGIKLSELDQKITGTAERSKLYHDDVSGQILTRDGEIKEQISQMRERIINLEKYLIESSRNRGGMEPQLYIPPEPFNPPVPNGESTRKPLRYHDERNL